jgi:hypothetical protein
MVDAAAGVAAVDEQQRKAQFVETPHDETAASQVVVQ